MGIQKRILCTKTKNGFTLMELVIVLVIIILISSLSWVSIINRLSNHQMTSAAEEIKAALVNARVEAMEKNVILQFYYQEDSGTYWVAPYNPDNYLASLDDGDPDSDQEDLSGLVNDDNEEASRKKLKYDVKFSKLEKEEDERAEALEEDLSVTNGNQSSQEPAIWFYPDGRTSTARITLIHPDKISVTLRIRGITGITTIGEFLKTGEVSE